MHFHFFRLPNSLTPGFASLRVLATGILLFLLAAPGLLASNAAVSSVESSPSTAPIKDLTLPTFTPEGYRWILFRGAEVIIRNADLIEAQQMHLTFFNEKADEKVETVFVSRAATYFPKRKFAEGSQGVRIIRDDAEISGEKWSYDHKDKKVVIDGNVRVIFHAPLKDILK